MTLLTRPTRIENVGFATDGGSTGVTLVGADGRSMHLLFDYEIGSDTTARLYFYTSETGDRELVELGSSFEDQLIELLNEALDAESNRDVVDMVRDRVEKLDELRRQVGK